MTSRDALTEPTHARLRAALDRVPARPPYQAYAHIKRADLAALLSDRDALAEDDALVRPPDAWALLEDRLRRTEAERDALAAPDPAPPLDEDDWNNIVEALEVASSYPQEMQVNRERWTATLAKVERAAPDPAPLDVERLARALRYTGDGEGLGYEGTRYTAFARNIAREYAEEPQP